MSVIISLIHSYANVKHWGKKTMKCRQGIGSRCTKKEGRGKGKPQTLCEYINQGFCPKHNTRPTHWAEYTALFSTNDTEQEKRDTEIKQTGTPPCQSCISPSLVLDANERVIIRVPFENWYTGNYEKNI